MVLKSVQSTEQDERTLDGANIILTTESPPFSKKAELQIKDFKVIEPIETGEDESLTPNNQQYEVLPTILENNLNAAIIFNQNTDPSD